MEDAAEALKMAFSVFAFIIAIGLAFTTFNQSKRVADIVVSSSDRTYVESYTESEIINEEKYGRIVGAETVIPNLYRYYKEKYTIEIANSSETIENVFDLDTEQRYRDGMVGDNNKNKNKPEYRTYKGTSYEQQLYPTGVYWLGSNTNTDAKLRVDGYVSGKPIKILGVQIEHNDYFNFSDTYRQKFEITKTGTRYSFTDPSDPNYDGTYVTEESGTTKINMTFIKERRG